MELNQAIRRIKKVSNKFPEEEIRYLQTHREDAIPALLETVRYTLDNVNDLREEYEDIDDPVFAMFLLAEFRVHDAFDLFIKLFGLDEEKCDWLFSDLITEDMPSLIASVADANDIDRIKALVENKNIGEFQRSSALRTLGIMYAEGMYPRAELSEYLGYLLSAYENDADLITHVVWFCADLCVTERYDRIHALYKANKVDTSMIGEDEFEEEQSTLTEEEVLEKLKGESENRLISDTVESTHWWACFKEDKYKAKPPTISKSSKMPKSFKPSFNFTKPKNVPATVKKIGRNAPCPCGSGKKYKHCCLNKKA